MVGGFCFPACSAISIPLILLLWMGVGGKEKEMGSLT
jgi:hypothetical protein